MTGRSASSTLPVLHIGFNKAGSTTLQGALFARHSQIFNMGEGQRGDAMDPDASHAVLGLMKSAYADPARRAPFDLQAARAHWGRAVAKGFSAGKVPLFSKESLIRPDLYKDECDDTLPAKLRELVGEAKIIVVVRQQIRLLESLYITRTKGHYYQPVKEWFAENRNSWIRMYRYHAVANSFARVFGRENVEVFLLEELANDAAALAERLSDFIGIDADEAKALLSNGKLKNRRTSRRMHLYSKLRKQLGPDIRFSQYVPQPVADAFVKMMARGAPAKVDFPQEEVAELEDYFREGNRDLAREWKLPLKDYGYPL